MLGKTQGLSTSLFGFEGGTCWKVEGKYRLFTTEVFDVPKTAATRLALWESEDGFTFDRVSTLVETNYDWHDTTHNMSPWAPMSVYDEETQRWNIFHVGYRRKAGSDQFFNMAGKIKRLESSVSGWAGVSGPYQDAGWIEFTDTAAAWEGSAGQVGFFPFRSTDGLVAFFAANDATAVIDSALPAYEQVDQGIVFRVGLASSESIQGPWTRLENRNPVLMDPHFVENPVVSRIDDDLFIAVFDAGNHRAMSYSFSRDGLTWDEARRMSLESAPANLAVARTPLGLIHQGDDLFTVFITAFDGVNPDSVEPLWHDGYGEVWRCEVRLGRL